jgi:hypothetical protein
MVEAMNGNDLRQLIYPKMQHMVDDLTEGQGDLEAMPGNIHALGYAIEKVKDGLGSIDVVLAGIMDDLNKERGKLEQQAMLDSYSIYAMNAGWPDPTDFVLKELAPRSVLYNEKDIAHFRSRVRLHGSWKHAGLMIRPLTGKYIEDMLPCDPLYIVDETQGLLAGTRQLFTPAYQRRLRYYTVNEKEQPYLTDQLPHHQLGFILVHEFFDVRPFEVIENYLKEFLTLLKPGGVVMFTFNNCDLHGPVKNFEAGLFCYTPGKLLRALVEKLGYEILAQYDSDMNVSWLEIKKPGESESMRGGQTLGKVKHVHQND